jgi:hypothetical protein
MGIGVGVGGVAGEERGFGKKILRLLPCVWSLRYSLTPEDDMVGCRSGGSHVEGRKSPY